MELSTGMLNMNILLNFSCLSLGNFKKGFSDREVSESIELASVRLKEGFLLHGAYTEEIEYLTTLSHCTVEQAREYLGGLRKQIIEGDIWRNKEMIRQMQDNISELEKELCP